MRRRGNPPPYRGEKMLTVLDLWSGTGSATKPFKDNGYHVITVDIDPSMNPSICMDIVKFRDMVLSGEFSEYLKINNYDLKFIWASPDCKLFSIANGQLSKHWHQKVPYSFEVHMSIARVAATLEIIDYLSPVFWALENPRGMLRTVPMMGIHHRRTVSYCQYGYDIMKPTDIWGYLPVTWKPKICSAGSDCHAKNPRGPDRMESKNYKQRIHVPYNLVDEIRIECEKREWFRLRSCDLFDFANESQ